MGKRAQKRMVYAATIVAVLAMASGFAMAALITPITSGNQNGYSVTAPGSTIYAAGSVSTNLVFTTASACTASGGTVAPASPATSADVYVTGETTCQSTNPDWFEEISFTSGTVTATSASDVFSITVNTNTPISVTVSYTGLSGTGTVTTNIYYEVGSSGTAVPSDIGVSGS